MRLAKVVAVLALAYVGLVATFESLLGIFQPAGESTLVITTSDRNGEKSDRVLARLELDNRLYVAVNHWPRAWYRQALNNPQVEIDLGGGAGDFVAVPISGAEFDRVDNEYSRGLGFKFLTGFPSREIFRLDPVAGP